MPKLPQYVSTIVPRAYNPPLQPPGGLMQPLAEGLESASRTLAIIDEQQREIKEMEQFFQIYGKAEQSMQALRERLEAEPVPDNFAPAFREEVTRIQSDILEQKVPQKVRRSLIPSLYRLFSQHKINIEADARQLRTSQIRANTEKMLLDAPKSIVYSEDPTDKDSKKTAFLTYLNEQEQRGFYTPLEAERNRQEFLRNVDFFQADRDLEADPIALIMLDEKTLVKKYPNLTLKDINTLDNKQNELRNIYEKERLKREKDSILLETNRGVAMGDMGIQELNNTAKLYGFTAEEWRPIFNQWEQNLNKAEGSIRKFMGFKEEQGPLGEEETPEGLIKNKQLALALTELNYRVRENDENPFAIWQDIAERALQTSFHRLRAPAMDTPETLQEERTLLIEKLKTGLITNTKFENEALKLKNREAELPTKQTGETKPIKKPKTFDELSKEALRGF